MLPSDFWRAAAFISVDLQEGPAPEPMTDEQLPADWRQMGFTAEDVNAANRHAHDVCLPNAVRVAQACREAGLPMIFIHWGFRMADGTDLDPVIRATMLRNHGADATQWPGYINHPHSQPAACLGVKPGDYVIAKTAQDAFPSSSLGHVLVNLNVRNLVMVGGHTEACLGKTATSAKRLGYRTLCVHDATNNARESTRMHGIEGCQFDAVLTTESFLAHLSKLAAS